MYSTKPVSKQELISKIALERPHKELITIINNNLREFNFLITPCPVDESVISAVVLMYEQEGWSIQRFTKVGGKDTMALRFS